MAFLPADFPGFPTDNGTGPRLDPLTCLELMSGALLNITVSRYIMAAGLTIALYDVLLLFSDEVYLVWSTRSKLSIRLLYFFNHYIPPAFLVIANYQMAPFRPPLSTNFCRGWIPLAICVQVITGICCSYMLTLRVIALYGDNKLIPKILRALFFLCYGVCVAACVMTIIETNRDMAYFIDLGGICSFSGNSIWFIVVMTSPIPVELVSGVLTIIKAFQHAHALWNASSAPLLHSVLRDGILFFLAVVALRLCNAFIWLLLPKNSIYLGLYLLWAPLSVMSTRFFLNIKSVTSVDPFSTTYASTMNSRRHTSSGKRGTMVKFASMSRPVSHKITISVQTTSHSDRTAVSFDELYSPDEYELGIAR